MAKSPSKSPKGKGKGKGKPPQKCPFCDKTYQDASSLKRHSKSKHPDQALTTVPKSPAKKCKYCHVMRVDISAHYKRCPKKPDESPEMTNKEFLEMFRQRLSRPGHPRAIGTVKEYVSKVKRMIKFEVQQDENFKACRWLSNPTDENHRVLRPVEEYVGDYSESSVKQLSAAYGALHEWILSILVEATQDPIQRHQRLKR